MLKEMKILGQTDSEFDCRVMKWATQVGRCHDLGSMDLPQEHRSKSQIHKAGD